MSRSTPHRWAWSPWRALQCAVMIPSDDAVIKFWQRNRPGDREELVANNFATFRSG